MDKYQTGIITLAMIGTLAVTGCSNDYLFNGQLTRKDNNKQIVEANVKVGKEFGVKGLDYQRPVLIEKINGQINKYYVESLDAKDWVLEKLVTNTSGDLPAITEENNPKAFKRAQEIINIYKDSIDVKTLKDLF
jgi:hypothetical protein